MKHIAKYGSLGLLVFAIGLVWHFPYERLSVSLTSQLQKTTGIKISIEELSPQLPIGFKATGVRLKDIPMGRDRLDMEFKHAKSSISPFSLLLYPFRKRVSFSYDALRETDRWEGDISYSPETFEGTLGTQKWKIQQSIPMKDINPMLAGSNLDIQGTFSLDVELAGKTPSLEKSDLSESDGKLKLKGSSIIIDAPIVKQIRIESVEILGDLKKGKLDIQSIKILGPDVSGTASGSLKLLSFLPRSQLELDAKLTLSKNKQELRDLVNMFGSQYNLKADTNGTIALKVKGPISPARRLSIRGY